MNQPRTSLSLFLKILCVFMGQTIMAQVTIVITELPDNTDKDSIYISGDFEGWSGGNEKYKLNKVRDHYSITLDDDHQLQHINFKFTRGSWATVEVNADGSNIENRAYSFAKQNDTLKISIEKWSDKAHTISTATNNVKLLADAFFMPGLNKKRRIWIYLPSSYQNSSKSYPVIYMHDGQNLFDDAIAYSGEWSVDETLNRLSMEKKLELIVVGIENDREERISEYSPWDIPKYDAKAQGEAYVNFIIEALKPYVDNEYRTLSNSTNTAIMGSSLGGVISHYAALKNSEIFGKSAVFSPSFELFPDSFDFAKKQAGLTYSKMYLMAGDQESEFMVYKMTEMAEIMTLAEFPKSNIILKVVKGGKHNENLWKNEFEEAITWLFLSE